MINIIEGDLIATGHKYGIAISRFNRLSTDTLKHGAIETLVRHVETDSDMTVVPVPGAFELPVVFQRMSI
jgi:6,7-dimethyl-8-ribityllumazine synthase